jgi:hypothetical protein
VLVAHSRRRGGHFVNVVFDQPRRWGGHFVNGVFDVLG